MDKRELYNFHEQIRNELNMLKKNNAQLSGKLAKSEEENELLKFRNATIDKKLKNTENDRDHA